MGTLDVMRVTEKRLVEVTVALSQLLKQEPAASIGAWAKTQLAHALRVAQDELVKLQVEIAEAEVACGKGRFVALTDATQEVVNDMLDAKKAREQQHPPRPCKDDKAE